MTRYIDLPKGTKVRLHETETSPEERARVVSYDHVSQTYVVELLPVYSSVDPYLEVCDDELSPLED